MSQPAYKSQIDAWIDAHMEDMTADLSALIRIPSVRGEAKEGMPYGKQCADALLQMQQLMEAGGLKTRNYENHCVAGDLYPDREKALDILVHLDVVPVSPETWTKTEPFEPLVEGDKIYGRGSSDDKGPAVAALYALRAIRELQIPLSHGVRLVCGSDEECGSGDLDYYYGIEEEAAFTISPDANYPLINIEKGRLESLVSAEGKQTEPIADPGQVRVISVQSGDKSNVIPGSARMVLSGGAMDLYAGAARETENYCGVKVSVEEQEDRRVVCVEGLVGHAAYPEKGVNALTAALWMLTRLPLAQREGEQKLLALAALWPHGDLHGQALGVNYSDPESGELTMSLDLLQYETKDESEDSYSLKAVFDCRAPLCANDENLTQKIRAQLEEAGFRMEADAMTPPHCVSADSELVQKLLDSYELYFGERGEPLAIGGGTYVHGLQNGVAFGCAESSVDNRMHGNDEFMKLSILSRSAKIIADAVIRLCG